MYAGRDFDPAETVENDIYGFDFINDIPTGDSIVGVTSYMTVQSGVDPSPSSRLIGTPFLSTDTIAIQRIAGMIAGVRYTFQMVATTQFGNVISLFAHIPCEFVV